MLKSFEHVGMTVSDMERTIEFYCGLLGLALTLRKTNADGSELAFLDAGGGMLEIVAPAGGAAPASDVPPGTAGLRHLTFLFDSIETAFARLEAAGVTVRERPRLAFNQEVFRKVAFVGDPDGIIVELAERAS
ncbi:VOC family protein [Aureimonas leprariae]|uniref:VOC family protein n=1 Tax=Plantimonas leprariae TaxID=2615207 RepID=A0A7V7PMA3_9HYPH|nr:VOC family protein [Aureimonas leprariae]KAB0677736.1 VOC family protein [Aureimonas leprariae]